LLRRVVALTLNSASNCSTVIVSSYQITDYNSEY
jgi:hypothetical protein